MDVDVGFDLCNTATEADECIVLGGSRDTKHPGKALIASCKRKSRDAPVEVVDDSVDFGVSRGLKSAKQKAVDSGEFKLLLMVLIDH